MTANFFSVLFLFCFSSVVSAQLSDSIVSFPDSASAVRYQELSNRKPFLQSGQTPVQYDVQQLNPSKSKSLVLVLMMGLLGLVTAVKVAFGKDWEELFQSLVNRNIAQQIFRTQSQEISFPSFLLHVNFVVVMSLYVQFVTEKFFHVLSFEKFSATLSLIFLFTFFYIAKLTATKFMGAVFELKEECSEYIFIFSSVCKTAGLTLLPALFIFYVTPEKYFVFVFAVTVFLLLFFFLNLIWQGLSTGYKLLYRSAYHFFIYVCVVEISPIFLLFKLLTKTIT